MKYYKLGTKSQILLIYSATKKVKIMKQIFTAIHHHLYNKLTKVMYEVYIW